MLLVFKGCLFSITMSTKPIPDYCGDFCTNMMQRLQLAAVAAAGVDLLSARRGCCLLPAHTASK